MTNKIFFKENRNTLINKNFFKGKNMKVSAVKNKNGYTILEAIPFIVIIFILLGAALGSWGLVHTALLHSIASRHGSFVYFNNRADLSYLRDFGDLPAAKIFYGRQNWRFSYVQSEKAIRLERQTATIRFVDFTSPNDTYFSGGGGGPFGNEGYKDDGNFLKPNEHNDIWKQVSDRRNYKKVAPAWIMVGYGICLTAKCSK